MSDSSKDTTKLSNPISVFLVEEQELILKKWVSRVKDNVETAKNLKLPIIVNTIPIFIKNLAEAIDENFEKTNANDSNNIAEEHGSERARITDYSPDNVILEYVILREVILEIIREKFEVSFKELTDKHS